MQSTSRFTNYLASPQVKHQALQGQHLLKTALVTTHISKQREKRSLRPVVINKMLADFEASSYTRENKFEKDH